MYYKVHCGILKSYEKKNTNDQKMDLFFIFISLLKPIKYYTLIVITK